MSTAKGDEDVEAKELNLARQTAFWLRHLRLLPTAYTSGDVQRMTLAYFCLGALDLLGVLDLKVDLEEQREYVDWIYAQQLDALKGGGFMAGPYIAGSLDNPLSGTGNLAMTYTAIINLAILGDDFTRLDVAAIRAHLRTLQQPDGSFAPSLGQAEYDCRFVYCAFAVCHMLDAWQAIDVDNAVRFLLASRSYDGAFGQAATQESHGGSTYCAVAALALGGRLDLVRDDQHLLSWLVNRQQSQQGGFNGRLNKPEDACYSFWNGATLCILGQHALIDGKSDVDWLLSCQTSIGGIAKTPDALPDVMHSYLGLAALALHAHDDEGHALRSSLSSLKQLDAALNISHRSLARLRKYLPRSPS
jgi:geranylgeranyl transferase type-1 subunit beta